MTTVSSTRNSSKEKKKVIKRTEHVSSKQIWFSGKRKDVDKILEVYSSLWSGQLHKQIYISKRSLKSFSSRLIMFVVPEKMSVVEVYKETTIVSWLA